MRRLAVGLLLHKLLAVYEVIVLVFGTHDRLVEAADWFGHFSLCLLPLWSNFVVKFCVHLAFPRALFRLVVALQVGDPGERPSKQTEARAPRLVRAAVRFAIYA